MAAPTPASFLIFIVLTIIYLASRAMFVDTWNNKIKKTGGKLWGLLTMCYVIALIIYQVKANVAATSSVCGAPQWSNIVIWTIIPNIIFFGSIFLMFKKFPGWKGPFANTFGYGWVIVR